MGFSVCGVELLPWEVVQRVSVQGLILLGGFRPGNFHPRGFCPGFIVLGGFCPGVFVQGVLSLGSFRELSSGIIVRGLMS